MVLANRSAAVRSSRDMDHPLHHMYKSAPRRKRLLEIRGHLRATAEKVSSGVLQVMADRRFERAKVWACIECGVAYLRMARDHLGDFDVRA